MRILPWTLLVATAAPVVAALVAAARVLRGDLDVLNTYTGPGYEDVDAAPALLDRLAWLTYSVGHEWALAAAGLGCVSLAACRWAPRPWQVAGPARGVAAALAGATGLVGLAAAVVVLVVTHAPLTPLQTQLSAPREPEPGTVVATVVSLGTPFSDAAVPAVLGGTALVAAWFLTRREATPHAVTGP
ncbi:hypothetical protein AB2L27_04240 [Kineococcus sp. LSe6-4]|uniref:Uncharacterized protein n=1 Tax=Kineococcus halophytocola TaxID=3234027 RepID=A0ABV4GXD9_9ACTN